VHVRLRHGLVAQLGQLPQQLALPSFSLVGVWTRTVTPMSPRPDPRRRGMPLPLTVILVPDCVPGGTSMRTDCSSMGLSSRSASRVASVTAVPRAAAVIGSRTTTSRSSPFRVNVSCSETPSSTYRSPAGPPPGPTSPWDSRWIRLPVATPAGILTLIVRLARTRPSPEHSPQGFGITVP